MLDGLRSRFATAREKVASAVSTASTVVAAVQGVMNGPPTVHYSALSPWTGYEGFGYEQRYQTGSKFEGGFGNTQVLTPDYWTLRARSRQLFKTNLYARGLIRRLVTNEVAVGLHLEATPAEKILGLEEDSLADWSEDVENRFALWQSDPVMCDHGEQSPFGQLQIQARMEALIEGDILVVMRQVQQTGLPRVQLILGSAVQSPSTTTVKLPQGHRIMHGVQLDPQGRQVGYWTVQADGTSKYIPAYGEKSGRRIAWLVYGTEKKLDDVRGEPLLSIVLQSLREIDRYRDSTQRKAVVNSMLAMFVKKTVDKLGSRPITTGAVKKGTVINGATTDVTPRKFNVAELIPGLVIDELQQGEEPVGFPSHGTDEKFGEFEKAVIQAIAWAHECPPEILMLSFSSNYSASQAALNEFKIYLNKARTLFGDNFCTPIYQGWLVSMVLANKILAAGLIEAWRDPRKRDLFAAYSLCDWSGNIKPSIDLPKLVSGYEGMIKLGAITYDRTSRELTGSKFSTNVKKIRLEAKMLADALAPLKALDPKFALAAKPQRSAEEEDEEEAKEAARAPLRILTSASV